MKIVEFEQFFGNFDEMSNDFGSMFWRTSTEYFLYSPEAKTNNATSSLIACEEREMKLPRVIESLGERNNVWCNDMFILFRPRTAC